MCVTRSELRVPGHGPGGRLPAPLTIEETAATIATAGKGGSGKTTVAGTMARVLARSGREVWAIDADSTPNLGMTLGLSRDASERLDPMPRSILNDEGMGEDGRRQWSLKMAPAEVVRRYAADTPDSVKLPMMGRVDHAGAG